MAILLKRRWWCPSSTTLPPYLLAQNFLLSSKVSDRFQASSGCYNRCPEEEASHHNKLNLELLDMDAWKLSSCLSPSRWNWEEHQKQLPDQEFTTDEADCDVDVGDEPDLEELDTMRVRGDLFYKLVKGSKEFDECNFDFRRKSSSKAKDDETEKEKVKNTNAETAEKYPRVVIKGREYYLLGDGAGKTRNPTFNQLTGPYHQPFCLDIFISRASVSAAVVHRVTSKVVAVAHSISKDIRRDIKSPRNAAACVLVGEVLAQRALADDIHDVVYTPRKGDKIEGKLQIVLQTIIDNGVNVVVKIKQRLPHRRRNFS